MQTIKIFGAISVVVIALSLQGCFLIGAAVGTAAHYALGAILIP